MNNMKIRLLFFIMLTVTGVTLFAMPSQARIVPGAEARLSTLLNRPALVRPASAVPNATLGRNWFTLELDTHVFSDQVSLNQVRAVLLDYDNHDRIFDGTRNKRLMTIISRSPTEIIADFTTVTPAPLGVQIRKTYRSSMRILANDETRFVVEIRQTSQDNSSNTSIKNQRAVRYVEEIVIDGTRYTYIRNYSINDVNGSILPNAQSLFERNAGPANEENLNLIIRAARNR